MSLKAAWLDTPLGSMLAISDEKLLYLLEFVDRRGLEREIERLRIKTESAIIPGSTEPILMIEEDLQLYFNGTLQKFNTPIWLLGSPFQKMVWQELINIPYGETRSYLNQAKALGKPNSYRAVANANGMNQLAIIVPCHRIINSNGKLGGYSRGLHRKKWLIEHERKFTTN
ncbi:methylated-DNA--protein-cysteine methyltransferase [Rickettsia conorii subsp. heilongjiangensis]|uniref:methylated-DNA--[protein]-cysteine S-methyltransferase n=2 Tax=spotted fever group TaxID=114277 RepID=A0AAD1LSU3_RICCR|nr:MULTISPECIES: methylated-DNA--[protein]-cysteine S-methyltransferase [spotted fever group]AEK74861.1 methylated-DNA--protein-cysteine methyltransferase [Rickettsia conorii subsp. heilongjiangensis 054]KJW04008.1 methylated-DNA-[]-cysteine S-methyltransferase family protein [Rickettsia argasii T170-B]UZW38241.1 methylated-DNA--[protein]-cysteine S-methyltransferase [Rickettsia conorii subsp. heilongjiangensis]BBM91606.1 methylated-DNA--protein-cysteine methyltransferase [Rickettsia conorii su